MNGSIIKRALALTLSAVLALSVTACGSKPAPTDSSASASEPNSSSTVLVNPLSEPSSIPSASAPTEPDQATVEKMKDHAAKNPDTVGWLKVPGTTIDDVMVQAKNNDYYLRKDSLGKYAFEGCYYVDYRNNIKDRASMGFNTIIYGHNINDDKDKGVKFAQLMKYTDLDFAQKNPYFYVTTPNDEMVFKIFATFYTNSRKFYYIKTDFPDLKVDAAGTTKDQAIKALVDEAKVSSEHVFNVDVNSTDKIVTLSTCTLKFGGLSNLDQRWVVMGRLLRADEKVTDPANIVKNPSPKVPTF